MEGGSVAADGTVVVAADSFSSNLWNLPLDANTGKVRGTPEALTQGIAFTAYPSISIDGKRLAFSSDEDGSAKVWLMDVPSRRRRRLTPLPGDEYRPILSPDGTRVAYLAGKTRDSITMVADATSMDQPGAPQNACDKQCVLIWDWWADNRGFLVTMSDVRVIGFVPSGAGVVEFTRSTNRLFQAHPSPDGQWIVIMNGSGMQIAHLQNGKMPDPSRWKPTGERGDLYRWSPDGNTVYFTDSRDGFRCIWGRHLNPATKEPVGEAFAVYHSHGARLSILGLTDSGAVGLAVARDRMVFAQAERGGNIWMGKLDLK
jgi:Tol biopolymer transport system component